MEKFVLINRLIRFNDCFLKVSVFIANLKSRGEIEATFELAKKTADSNDVTGISQMYLGIMYDLGEGTQKNVPSLSTGSMKL